MYRGGVGIERLGIVGAGLMGAEIARVAAGAGLAVVLRDVDDGRVAAGMERPRAIGARRVDRGRMTPDEADALLRRATPTVALEPLAGCDLVLEAVTEVLEVKLEIAADLGALLAPGALIASNTSGLSITAIGRATGRPDRVLGLHFFNPASVMRLVEVVRGQDTSDATLEAGDALAERLGKTPVRVRECPGFLVSRMLVRAMAQAHRVAAREGAGPAAVDAAVVASGPAPMGPFALGDLVGLDTLDHVRRGLAEAYGGRFDDGGLVARRVAAGRLGRKSGAGFLAGAPEEAPGEPDEAARAAARAYYEGAPDEARRCVEEGIVAGPEDVDLGMVLGAGWSEGPIAQAA